MAIHNGRPLPQLSCPSLRRKILLIPHFIFDTRHTFYKSRSCKVDLDNCSISKVGLGVLEAEKKEEEEDGTNVGRDNI